MESYILLWHSTPPASTEPHIPISLSVNSAQGSSEEKVPRRDISAQQRDRSQSVNRVVPFSASYEADNRTTDNLSFDPYIHTYIHTYIRRGGVTDIGSYVYNRTGQDSVVCVCVCVCVCVQGLLTQLYVNTSDTTSSASSSGDPQRDPYD